MFYQTEAKLQAWRALAVFADRSECLIFVGRSTSQVRENYAKAYLEILDDDERAQVQSITLQCWHGAADRGHWIQKSTLPVPAGKPATVPSGEEQESPTILPFRRPAPAPAVEEQEQEQPQKPRKSLATTA